jgi:integrase
MTSPWLLPLVTLALNTGMRQGELLKLKWENIDLERGGDNDHPEQDPAAKDHCHQRASAAGVKLASSKPVRRASVHVALGCADR